jgi:hypothetical protein
VHGVFKIIWEYYLISNLLKSELVGTANIEYPKDAEVAIGVYANSNMQMVATIELRHINKGVVNGRKETEL